VTTALPRYIWAIVAALALTLSLATPAAAKTNEVVAISLGWTGGSHPSICSVGVAIADGTSYQFEGDWTSNTSNSGNVTFTCSGELTSAPPATAIKAANSKVDFACWDAENERPIYTYTWDVHITPSGNATYSCHYKAS
jgi:hypothetical protein